MYRIIIDNNHGIEVPQIVHLNADGSMLAFLCDPANTDYQTFKRDVNAGAELQDADGVAMTHAAAVAYVKTLP